jgi:tetratricopeptide (TPR) repeat protein
MINKEQPMSTFVTTKAEGILNKPFIHLPAIIFITFLIYSNTFNVPFQFDDAFIAKSISIHDPHNYLPPKANRDAGLLTFSLNYKLNGFDVFGFHATNLLIHMLNVVLVYSLVSLTFRTPFFMPLIHNKSSISRRNTAHLFAFFACGLFAVHPLQTESVTYIVQRFTSLATFFYLLSLVMYIKWRKDKEQQVKRSAPHAMLYAISLLSAVLAMKTKEIAFTLPVCITVYEFMFFRGKLIKRVLYLIPLLLTILIIPMTLLSLNAPLGDIIGDVGEVTRDHPDIPRLSYLFTQFRVIVTYIRLLILPINQNLDYDYPVYHSLLDPAVFLSFIFLLLVFGLGVYLYRISRITHYTLRIAAFGIFWFFITLSVESSVIPIRDMIFEHRVYLPSVGFFMALTGAIGAGMERWGSRTAYAKKAIIYGMLAVMLLLSGATYARNTVWKDRLRLWGDAVEGSPNKARPHNYLGNAYEAQGKIDEAINEYQTALKLNPDYADTHNNLGNAYKAQGKIDEAINEYQTAIELKPDYAEAHNNLGVAYGTQGKIDAAINEYQAALKLNPGHVKAHNNLGNIYAEQGRFADAINEYQTALKLNPDFDESYYNLGLAYATQGRIDDAMREYNTALKLNPGHARAHNNLGNIHAEQGRFADATNEYQTALKLNPDDADMHNNLGVMYAKQGKLADAIDEYQTALSINPGHTKARQNLRSLLK